MVRESAKHGPRLDEEMRRETEGAVRSGGSGAVGESGGDGEMAGVRRTQGRPEDRRPAAPGGMTPRKVAWRSELAQILSPMGFPATRGRILAYLNEVDAPNNVRLALIGLPKDRQFANVGEVVRALGVDTETGEADTETG